MGYKTLSIKDETWIRLRHLQTYSSQTFDTIINNLIDIKEGLNPSHIKEVNQDDTKNKNDVEEIQENKNVY